MNSECKYAALFSLDVVSALLGIFTPCYFMLVKCSCCTYLLNGPQINVLSYGALQNPITQRLVQNLSPDVALLEVDVGQEDL